MLQSKKFYLHNIQYLCHKSEEFLPLASFYSEYNIRLEVHIPVFSMPSVHAEYFNLDYPAIGTVLDDTQTATIRVKCFLLNLS